MDCAASTKLSICKPRFGEITKLHGSKAKRLRMVGVYQLVLYWIE